MIQREQQSIRELIRTADLKSAINALHTHNLPKKIQNELDGLSARLSENERRYRKGVLKEEDYTLEKNRITESLIAVLDLMDEASITEKQSPNYFTLISPRNAKLIFGISFIVFIVMVSLVFIVNNFYLKKENSTLNDEVEEPENIEYPDTGKKLANTKFLDESTENLPHDISSSYDFSKEMTGANKEVLDSLIRLKQYDKALKILYRHASEPNIQNRDTLRRYITAIQIAKENTLDEVFPDFPSKFILGIKNNKQGIFDKSKNMISGLIYDEINPLFESIYVTRIGKRYGFLNANGIEIVKTIYDDIYPEFDPLIWVEKDGKEGLIDMSGNIIQKTIYDAILPPNEGMMQAQKDGLWGFFDTTGQIKIEFQYDSAESFSDGKAFVVKGSKLFYVNIEGAIVGEAK